MLQLVFLEPDGHPPRILDTNDGENAVVLAVPGASVTTHFLSLSGSTPAQRTSEARLQLKDRAAVSLDESHVAVGEKGSGDMWPACVVARAALRAWLDEAALQGIAPDAVVPDHLLLPDLPASSVAVVLGDEIVARGPGIAFTADSDLAALLMKDREWRIVSDRNEADALFSAGAKRPAINLLQFEFARRRPAIVRGKEFRRAGILAAVLLLSPLLLWTAQIIRYETAAYMLNARTETVAREATRHVETSDPVSYLRGRFAALSASGRFLDASAALFAAVSRIEGGELDSLSYLRDGAIQAVFVHSDAAAAQTLLNDLTGNGLQIEIGATLQQSGMSATQITLRPGL